MTATVEQAPPAPVNTEASPERFRPTLNGWLARAGLVVGLAAIALLYIFNSKPFRSDDPLAAGIVIAIGALSLNVLIGYTGQISLGHQAFIGIGAFGSAYVMTQSHQSFYVAVVAGIAIGVVQACVLGLIALRVRGLYFALITLAWGSVAEACIFRWNAFTGGGAGQPAPRPGGFTTDRAYLLICVIALVLVMLVDWRLVESKAGRAMQALRESPQVAANYGVNVRAYTLMAFAVSGAYAGLAGALFASRRTTVVAVDFSFATIALPYLVVTVVGGLRRRGGIVAFALLYKLGGTYMPELFHRLGLPKNVEANAGYIVQSIAGVLAILTLIFQPDGLGTITAPLGRWLKGERFSLHGGDAGPGAEAISARP